MIRVVAIDLDGTLLRNDTTISSETIQILRMCQERSKLIILASARPPRTIGRLLPDEFRNNFWICYNGAEIYEARKKIYQNLIDPSAAKKIIELAQTHIPTHKVSLEIDDELFANQRLKGFFTYQIVDLSTICHRSAAKIMIDLSQGNVAQSLLKNLPPSCKAVVTDNGNLAQIMAHLVSKAQALQFILDSRNLTFENVIAFGDDANDIEMIKESKIGVAMDSTVPEVKAVADYVTKSNDEDGVAEVLEKYFPIS